MPRMLVILLFLCGTARGLQADSGEPDDHQWFRPRLTEPEAIAAFEEFIARPKNNLLANCEYKKTEGRKKKKRTRILEVVYEKDFARVEIEYRMTCSTLKYRPPRGTDQETKPGRMRREEDTLEPGVEGKTYRETRKRDRFIFVWKDGHWVVEKKEEPAPVPPE